jgi:hypothetical protein
VSDLSGWTIVTLPSGVVACCHSGGFYVSGFDSKAEAAVWLGHYLLGQQIEELRQARRTERARLRILAEMKPHGRVS